MSDKDAPVEEKPAVKASGAPPKLFEDAPRTPVIAREMPPLTPEEPTQDIGQFLAHQPTAPAEDLWATEIKRRKVATEPPKVLPSVPPVAAPPSQRAPATRTPNPDNPWATEMLRRRAVVPEHPRAPGTVTPPDELGDGTEIVSRSSSFGASVSDATRTEEHVSAVSGTLVGAPAFALDEQVTTIERNKRPAGVPVVPVGRGPAHAPPMHAGPPSTTSSEQSAALMRRGGAAPKQGGSRVVIVGAIAAFLVGVMLVVALMTVRGVLPLRR